RHVLPRAWPSPGPCWQASACGCRHPDRGKQSRTRPFAPILVYANFRFLQPFGLQERTVRLGRPVLRHGLRTTQRRLGLPEPVRSLTLKVSGADRRPLDRRVRFRSARWGLRLSLAEATHKCLIGFGMLTYASTLRKPRSLTLGWMNCDDVALSNQSELFENLLMSSDDVPDLQTSGVS